MTDLQNEVIALIRSALTNSKDTVEENADWKAIITIAKKHNILPIIYYGIYNSNCSLSKNIINDLKHETFRKIFVDQNQLYQVKLISNVFENYGIDHILLKGSVLKNLYPKSEMRIMGDADILIQKEDVPKASTLLSKLGYVENTERNGDYDTVFDKKGVLHLELHWNIVSPYNKDYYSYFGDGWRFAKLKKGLSHSYELGVEDHLVYIFAHFANHYRHGGIGIKHLLDIWIYNQKYSELDKEYLYSCLRDIKLDVFYDNVLKTLDCWFTKCDGSEITDFITNKIFESGSYGTPHTHRVSSEFQKIKQGGFIKNRLFLRVIPPFYTMQKKYPIIGKHKFLLPVFWFYRLFSLVFINPRKLKQGLSRYKNVKQKEILEYQKSLNLVGLDFNFKEK